MSLDPSARLLVEAPQIQIYARAVGGVEYVCPTCYRFQLTSQIHWRRPTRLCTHAKCRLTVTFGLLFCRASAYIGNPAPMNAMWALKKADKRVANCLHFVPEGKEWVGQVVGKVEWWCPECSTHNLTRPSARLSEMSCKACASIWNVGLIVYAAVQGAHNVTPADWIPPWKLLEGTQ